MRKFVLIAALAASLCATAVAGPKEEAQLVVDKWSKAFAAADVDGIVKLYSSDALFLGTGSKSLVNKTEDIRKYFEAALFANRPRTAILGDHSLMVLSDDAVVITGMDMVTGTKDGNVINAYGRTTFVVAKRGPAWQIVHFHRSALPN